jgi:hypothetical protein
MELDLGKISVYYHYLFIFIDCNDTVDSHVKNDFSI